MPAQFVLFCSGAKLVFSLLSTILQLALLTMIIVARLKTLYQRS